jgi:hypothetical protein
VLRVDRDVLPVTPRVPPIVALFVTDAELRVARPEVLRVDRDVLPVTPRVPPIVALTVTPKEFNVAAADELNVVNAPVLAVVAPIDVPFIVPPVIVTPDEVRALAVKAPLIVVVTVDLPIVRAEALTVPIDMEPFAAVAVPASIVIFPEFADAPVALPEVIDIAPVVVEFIFDAAV